jgi:D-alanyl-D-alanine carboxypeptidase
MEDKMTRKRKKVFLRRRQRPVFVFSVIALGSFAVISLLSQAFHKKMTSGIDTAFASAITPGSVRICSSDDRYSYIPPTLESDNLNWGFQGSNSALREFESKDDASFVPATKIDTDPNSITVLINREYVLGKDFVPEDLVQPKITFSSSSYGDQKLMRAEAAFALEYLVNAASEDGCSIYGVSGYRSYDRQLKIFQNNIRNQGKEHTLMYSAVPGASEHQSGLSIDLSTASLSGQLLPSFADTSEGQWLKKNAYKFGFIIRYPKGKEKITGYAYEPWHIRYVGRGLSKYIYEHNLTLDEYYHYKPSANFNFETTYDDLINYKAPTPKPRVTGIKAKATPTAKPTIAPAQQAENINPDDDETPSFLSQPKKEQEQPGTTAVPTQVPTATAAPQHNSGGISGISDANHSTHQQATAGQDHPTMNALSSDDQTVSENGSDTP